MNSVFRVKPLLLVLLLVLGLGALAAASLSGFWKDQPTAAPMVNNGVASSDGLACPAGVRCFTPSTLGGRSIWQESGFTAASFNKAFVVAPADIKYFVSDRIKIGGWARDKTIDSRSMERMVSAPTIFAYLPGDSPSEANQYWPVDFKTATGMVAKNGSFVAVGEVKGQPRMLLAARDHARLQQLAGCVLEGPCPELNRTSVSPWKEVAGALPEWAELAVTVDLRKPAENGTAIVYAEGRKGKVSLGGGAEWSARPTNLRATFFPADGRLMAALPDYRSALAMDSNGRLVYEVQPLFIPGGSGVRSQIFEGGAYLHMAHLLPDLRSLGRQMVAVRWLLPEGWSANVPGEQTGDWYGVEASELMNQYVAAGPLSYHTFTAGQTRFTVGLLGMDAAERTRWNGLAEKALRLLVERLGDPPTDAPRDFRLTVFKEGLTDGGSAGARTATTMSDERVTLHEVIHWWVGIWSKDDIPAWHESMTDWLATRTMLDLGAATEEEYATWLQVRPSYDRLTKRGDVWIPVYFQRDLDLLIRKETGDRSTLFDVVRYYHATAKYKGGASLSREQFILLIKEATGVDPRTYFDGRY